VIFGHLGLRNPEPIELKFGTIDYVGHNNNNNNNNTRFVERRGAI